MLSAGVDIGARTVKLVLVEGGEPRQRVILPAGADALAALARAWQEAGVSRSEVARLGATGMGAATLADADGLASPEAAAARGVAALFPQARTVISVGAEEGLALKLDERGRVLDSVVNERCAAGAGIFAEIVARALEVSLEELGRLGLEGGGKVAMNAQCVVFAESEMVALLHAGTPPADIAWAVHQAMAERLVAIVRRLGLQEKVALIGGVARNPGLVQALGRGLATELLLPEEPEFTGALGAALLAAEGRLAPRSGQEEEGRHG